MRPVFDHRGRPIGLPRLEGIGRSIRMGIDFIMERQDPVVERLFPVCLLQSEPMGRAFIFYSVLRMPANTAEATIS